MVLPHMLGQLKILSGTALLCRLYSSNVCLAVAGFKCFNENLVHLYFEIRFTVAK